MADEYENKKGRLMKNYLKEFYKDNKRSHNHTEAKENNSNNILQMNDENFKYKETNPIEEEITISLGKSICDSQMIKNCRSNNFNHSPYKELNKDNNINKLETNINKKEITNSKKLFINNAEKNPSQLRLEKNIIDNILNKKNINILENVRNVIKNPSRLFKNECIENNVNSAKKDIKCLIDYKKQKSNLKQDNKIITKEWENDQYCDDDSNEFDFYHENDSSLKNVDLKNTKNELLENNIQADLKIEILERLKTMEVKENLKQKNHLKDRNIITNNYSKEEAPEQNINDKYNVDGHFSQEEGYMMENYTKELQSYYSSTSSEEDNKKETKKIGKFCTKPEYGKNIKSEETLLQRDNNAKLNKIKILLSQKFLNIVVSIISSKLKCFFFTIFENAKYIKMKKLGYDLGDKNSVITIIKLINFFIIKYINNKSQRNTSPQIIT